MNARHDNARHDVELWAIGEAEITLSFDEGWIVTVFTDGGFNRPRLRLASGACASIEGAYEVIAGLLGVLEIEPFVVGFDGTSARDSAAVVAR